MTQFEDKFMEIQIDMISLAMEYVQNQADKIFIYWVAEGFYSFDVFFKTNIHYLDRDEIAAYLPIMNEPKEVENLRIPSGNEGGVIGNVQWRLGGKTYLGGVPESVINRVPKDKLNIKELWSE